MPDYKGIFEDDTRYAHRIVAEEEEARTQLARQLARERSAAEQQAKETAEALRVMKARLTSLAGVVGELVALQAQVMGDPASALLRAAVGRALPTLVGAGRTEPDMTAVTAAVAEVERLPPANDFVLAAVRALAAVLDDREDDAHRVAASVDGGDAGEVGCFLVLGLVAAGRGERAGAWLNGALQGLDVGAVPSRGLRAVWRLVAAGAVGGEAGGLLAERLGEAVTRAGGAGDDWPTLETVTADAGAAAARQVPDVVTNQAAAGAPLVAGARLARLRALCEEALQEDDTPPPEALRAQAVEALSAMVAAGRADWVERVARLRAEMEQAASHDWPVVPPRSESPTLLDLLRTDFQAPTADARPCRRVATRVAAPLVVAAAHRWLREASHAPSLDGTVRAYRSIDVAVPDSAEPAALDAALRPVDAALGRDYEVRSGRFNRRYAAEQQEEAAKHRQVAVRVLTQAVHDRNALRDAIETSRVQAVKDHAAVLRILHTP